MLTRRQAGATAAAASLALAGGVTAAVAASLALAGGVTAAVAAQATRATAVAAVAGANRPLDAAPDPAGRTIYYSTVGSGGPAIYRVAAAGGPVTAVRRGAPLVDPVGLAVAADGRQLFVADRGAGRILVVPVGTGRVATLAGSAATDPNGLTLDGPGSARRLVFAGRDPSTWRPAVLALSTAGSSRPVVVTEGAPLVAPQGVAVAGDGTIYVSDRGRGGALAGRVLRIAAGRISQIAGGLRLGSPAGIALTRDGRTLLVSSLDPAAGTAQVLRIDTRTLATSTFNAVIGVNRAAGGLHRGLQTTVMGWADVSRSGRIYRVDP